MVSLYPNAGWRCGRPQAPDRLKPCLERSPGPNAGARRRPQVPDRVDGVKQDTSRHVHAGSGVRIGIGLGAEMTGVAGRVRVDAAASAKVHFLIMEDGSAPSGSRVA
ncbi:hypothetical protein Sm713_58820 [Streptomyces sp. TS71-3]|nr:hypothetical protein Sm713_58820 [Streptomyces sp. TS71-3]